MHPLAHTVTILTAGLAGAQGALETPGSQEPLGVGMGVDEPPGVGVGVAV